MIIKINDVLIDTNDMIVENTDAIIENNDVIMKIMVRLLKIILRFLKIMLRISWTEQWKNVGILRTKMLQERSWKPQDTTNLSGGIGHPSST